MARDQQHDLYESTLVEIGRITTTWAKFEHWVDVAIWYLADVEDRRGACSAVDLAGAFDRLLQQLKRRVNYRARPAIRFLAGQFQVTL